MLKYDVKILMLKHDVKKMLKYLGKEKNILKSEKKIIYDDQKTAIWKGRRKIRTKKLYMIVNEMMKKSHLEGKGWRKIRTQKKPI